MDKYWIRQRKAESWRKVNAEKDKLCKQILSFEGFNESLKEELVKCIEDNYKHRLRYITSLLTHILVFHKNETNDISVWLNFVDSLDFQKITRLTFEIEHIAEYLDSEPMEFDGDIFITDPCYFLKDDSHNDDWDTCCCGFYWEAFGISHYMTRDTIYGDWSCSVYDSETKEEIGEFCADSGLVTVMPIDEIKKYNPGFPQNKNIGDYCYATIHDFKGTVQFIVCQELGTYDYDCEFWKKGDPYEDFYLKIEGHGVNKKTGEKIDFFTSQSGL